MENRFNELDMIQQGLVRELINALAANNHVTPNRRDRIVVAATEEVREAGREAMTLEDVR